MAKIVPSANAPDESVHYSFSTGEFDLGVGDTYESNDATLLGEANAHPWLNVEVDAETVDPPSSRPSVDPAKDPLSAQNPANQTVNDPEAVRAVEEAKFRPDPDDVTAIDAGLDQGSDVTTGGVDETLSAADVPAFAADDNFEGDNE